VNFGKGFAETLSDTANSCLYKVSQCAGKKGFPIGLDLNLVWM
jgi:hypothetical protein